MEQEQFDKLIEEAKARMDVLKAAGWTQQDFAKMLKTLLGTPVFAGLGLTVIEPPRFTEPFGAYAGDKTEIEYDGFTITATLHDDDNQEEPWSREDGHGPVSEWTQRDKHPGERVLCVDRQSKRYYDFAEAVKIAKKDGWDTQPYGVGTPGERAARAAEADYKVLRAWCDNEWNYVGVAVTVSRDGVQLTGKYDHALWGVECNYPGSDNSYLLEVANEEIDGALNAARAKLDKLTRK